VDDVRKRLGGRASTDPRAGDLVMVTAPGGRELPGVVLFASGEDMDVWVEQPGSAVVTALGAGIVRRARGEDVGPLRGVASKDLTAVASDARVFGGLLEGQRIRYQSGEGLDEGTLVEKCRFGALVERDDGALVGVGFRRIWPAHGPARDAGEQN
jgi:hypothetical protein